MSFTGPDYTTWRVVIRGEMTQALADALDAADITRVSGHSGRGYESNTLWVRGRDEPEVRDLVGSALDRHSVHIASVERLPYWVYIEFGPGEAEALEVAARSHEGLSGIVITEEPGYAGSVVLEVPAVSQEAAMVEARRAYDELRERAGIPASPSALAWLFPPLEPAPLPEHLLLLDKARAALDAGEHQWAVVVAQAACEVYALQALREVARTQLDAPDVADAVLRLVGNSGNMKDGRVRELWTALTGRHFEDEPWWPDYVNVHLPRRHEIAHMGRPVTLPEATASVDLAESFIRFIGSAMIEADET